MVQQTPQYYHRFYADPRFWQCKFCSSNILPPNITPLNSLSSKQYFFKSILSGNFFAGSPKSNLIKTGWGYQISIFLHLHHHLLILLFTRQEAFKLSAKFALLPRPYFLRICLSPSISLALFLSKTNASKTLSTVSCKFRESSEIVHTYFTEGALNIQHCQQEHYFYAKLCCKYDHHPVKPRTTFFCISFAGGGGNGNRQLFVSIYLALTVFVSIYFIVYWIVYCLC